MTRYTKKIHITFLFLLFSLIPAYSLSTGQGSGWVQWAKDIVLGGEQEDQVRPVDLLFYNFDKKASVYRVLESGYKSVVSIITPYEWHELDLEGLLKKLDRTQTCYGLWGLRRSIEPRVKDKHALANQQRMHVLIEHEYLFRDLCKAINSIARYDDALLAYFNPDNRLHNQAKKLYYTLFDQQLNYNKWALEGVYVTEVGKSAADLGAALFFFNNFNKGIAGEDGPSDIFSRESTSLFQKIGESLTMPLVYHSIRNIILQTNQQKEQLYRSADEGLDGKVGAIHKVFFLGSLKDQYDLLTERFGIPRIIAATCAMASLGLYDIGLMLRVRDTAQHLMFLKNTASLLRGELVKVARIFDAMEIIARTVSDYPVLRAWKPISLIDDFMHHPEQWGEKMAMLVSFLQKQTFDDGQDNEMLYSRGDVLMAHRLLLDVRHELVPLLRAIGHVDALLSMVSIYKEYQWQDNPFCFVQFLDDEAPGCMLHDVWSPLIVGDTVIGNSISLGLNNQPNKVVLTGPNGGGKSTVMQAIIHAFVLAQSWGIIPAKEAHIAPLTAIRTALNPQGDVDKGLSLFMAEKQRMEYLESFIALHDTSCDRVLIAVDEPYKGTVSWEAERRIYRFGQDISSCDQSLVFIATHLTRPINLEEETGRLFVNYQMEFKEDARGSLSPSYRLAPGAALWWFTDDSKRSRYIDGLLENI